MCLISGGVVFCWPDVILLAMVVSLQASGRMSMREALNEPALAALSPLEAWASMFAVGV